MGGNWAKCQIWVTCFFSLSDASDLRHAVVSLLCLLEALFGGWLHFPWLVICRRTGWAGMATFPLPTRVRANCRARTESRRPSGSCRGSAGSRKPACWVMTSLQLLTTVKMTCKRFQRQRACGRRSHDVSYKLLHWPRVIFQTKPHWGSWPLRDAHCLTSWAVRTCWGGGGGGGDDMPSPAWNGTRPTWRGGVFPSWLPVMGLRYCFKNCHVVSCFNFGEVTHTHHWGGAEQRFGPAVAGCAVSSAGKLPMNNEISFTDAPSKKASVVGERIQSAAFKVCSRFHTRFHCRPQRPQLPVTVCLARHVQRVGGIPPRSRSQKLERRRTPDVPPCVEPQRGGCCRRWHQSVLCPPASRRRLPVWRPGRHAGPRLLPQQGRSWGWHSLWQRRGLELWRCVAHNTKKESTGHNCLAKRAQQTVCRS